MFSPPTQLALHVCAVLCSTFALTLFAWDESKLHINAEKNQYISFGANEAINKISRSYLNISMSCLASWTSAWLMALGKLVKL